MRTATIDYHGVPLVCEFSYYAGFAGTLESPPEPETAEINTVLAGAVDITDILTEDQIDELSIACLEWVSEERDRAMEARAEREREERANA